MTFTAIANSELIEYLREARARTLKLVNDLSDEQLIGPRLQIVNPLLWEIGVRFLLGLRLAAVRGRGTWVVRTCLKSRFRW